MSNKTLTILLCLPALILGLFGLLFACGGDGSEGHAAKTETAVVETVKEEPKAPEEEIAKPEPEAEPTPEPEPDVEEIEETEEEEAPAEESERSESDKVYLYKSDLDFALYSFMPGTYDVDVDYGSKLINVLFTFDGVTAEALLGKMRTGETPEEWKSLRASTESTCAAWYKKFTDYDLDGWNLSMNIRNDINEDNIILTVLDGVTIMDAVEAQ